MLLLATKGPIADFTGEPSIEDLLTVMLGLIIVLATVSAAYFHWSLKPVPLEEDIWSNPILMSDEDIAKRFWQR